MHKSTTPPCCYSGGSAQSITYKQRGGSSCYPHENAELRKWYYPNEITDNRVIQIYPQLNEENYQFKTQMKKLNLRSSAGPCLCCFRNHGRIWMMKGTGIKEKCKNKGMKKRRFNYYYY